MTMLCPDCLLPFVLGQGEKKPAPNTKGKRPQCYFQGARALTYSSNHSCFTVNSFSNCLTSCSTVSCSTMQCTPNCLSHIMFSKETLTSILLLLMCHMSIPGCVKIAWYCTRDTLELHIKTHKMETVRTTDIFCLPSHDDLITIILFSVVTCRNNANQCTAEQ